MSAEPRPFQDLLGRFAQLQIRRFSPSGAFLARPEDGPQAPTILLLGPEIPQDAQEGDEVEVFICLDSEARPLATTKVPKLAMGEVAYLRVTACTPFGAFVDWGLPKELLVPFAEQICEVREGESHFIGLYIDPTGRLAGTMRVTEILKKTGGDFRRGQWVQGEAWRYEPEIGLFVIIEHRFLGLVPRHEPTRLDRGQEAQFRVTHVHPDGKVELSARALAHEEMDTDGEKILALLARPNPPKLGDHSSPEQIHQFLGLSKKAFKRAVGRLLKQDRVSMDSEGNLRTKTG
jgi:predicted RNA-binding protein (virulence factor B family)